MKRLIAALLLIVLFGGMTAQASEFSLKDYSVFTFGERMLVYQGPGEDYYRNGSAAIGINISKKPNFIVQNFRLR